MTATSLLVVLLVGTISLAAPSPTETTQQSGNSLQLVWLEDMVEALAGSSAGSSTSSGTGIAQRLAKGEAKEFNNKIRESILSKSKQLAPVKEPTQTQQTREFVDPDTGLQYRPDWDQLARSAAIPQNQVDGPHLTSAALRVVDQSDFVADDSCWVFGFADEADDYLQDSSRDITSKWVLHSTLVPGSLKFPDKKYIVSIVYADQLSWLRNQFNEVYDGSLPFTGKLGMQVIASRADTGDIIWTSGSGEIGDNDGSRLNARFSDRITSLSFMPSCAQDDYNNEECPATSREGFYRSTQYIYVADSGNCKIRLIDFQTGRVSTRWGSLGCVAENVKNHSGVYVNSEVPDQVVLGRNLSLAWAGWKYLLIADKDANQIRKHVPSQHQGVSVLAGTGVEDCVAPISSDGLSSTFCRPDAIAVTREANGQWHRAVVSEEYLGVDDWTARRLRILDLNVTYLDGGDVRDVIAYNVRSLTPTFGTTMRPSFFFTGLGGMHLTPNGEHLIAGSFDPILHPFFWAPTEARKDYIVVVSLPSGSLPDGTVRIVNVSVASGLEQGCDSPNPPCGTTLVGIDDYSSTSSIRLVTLKHTFENYAEADGIPFYYVSITPKVRRITVALSGDHRINDPGTSCTATRRRIAPSEGAEEEQLLGHHHATQSPTPGGGHSAASLREKFASSAHALTSSLPAEVGLVQKGRLWLLRVPELVKELSLE